MNYSRVLMPDDGGTLNGTDVESPTPALDDEMREFSVNIIMCVMFPLNIMGIITNIINIRVFLEQGIKDDSTNIGFLALSIYDLASCMFMLPYNLCYVAVYSLGKEHYTCTAYATIFLYVHVLSQHSSAWTTVYISVIRTACVVIPLKVKILFKPTMARVYVVFLFLFFTVNQIMYAAFTEMKHVVHPTLNVTIAYIADTSFSEAYLYWNSIFSNQFLPVAGLIIVTITTGLMSHKLFEVRKWRQKTLNTSNIDPKTGDDGKKPLASKDIELIKSVTTVTVIYLVCLLMSFIPSSAIVFLPGVSFSGINRNLFLLLYMIRFLFDSVNSSINYFFYIRISTRYREAFIASFPGCACVVPNK